MRMILRNSLGQSGIHGRDGLVAVIATGYTLEIGIFTLYIVKERFFSYNFPDNQKYCYD